MDSISTWWMWSIFFIVVLLVLSIDILILNNKNEKKVKLSKAAFWTGIWITCALVFGLLLWFYLYNQVGPVIANQKALEFFTGYIIEQSLSVDNLFVFILIFNYFVIPPQYQKRVLIYGVLGAIIMRLIMILCGTWLVKQFHWILYIFGAFLVYTGFTMLLIKDKSKNLDDNVILKIVRKYMRVTSEISGEKFFIKQGLLWYATPLFLALLLIEVSDVIFALDSIPAILSVTHDPFIIFTSNIFAIMGLRSLYFVLVHMAERFYLLKYGIALVLMFVGVKMLIEPWYIVPILGSLALVISILATTVILSLLGKVKET